MEALSPTREERRGLTKRSTGERNKGGAKARSTIQSSDANEFIDESHVAGRLMERGHELRAESMRILDERLGARVGERWSDGKLPAGGRRVVKEGGG